MVQSALLKEDTVTLGFSQARQYQFIQDHL